MSNKLKVKKSKQNLPKPPLVTKRLWHYTVYQTLQEILQSEIINVSAVGIDKDERPAVWFSSNPDFEQTVRKTFRGNETGNIREGLSREELFRNGFPPVRIEIDPSKVQVYDWELFKMVGGASQKVILAMEKTGREFGAAPSEWYVSFRSVPLASCLQPIEIWDGSEWLDINEAPIMEFD